MTKIIDGKALAAVYKEEIKTKIQELLEVGKEVSLSIIMVGNDPASQVYMESKVKTFNKVGIKTNVYELSANTDTDSLIYLIKKQNLDKNCDGIIIEQPLPEHIDRKRIILAIDPNKDVDGLHPMNLGALCTEEDGFLCCTPAGVMELLKRSDIELEGKECVVVGRSNIVGKPMSLLMLKESATVTVAHSKTKDLKRICKGADILILATGNGKMFNRDYVKEGAVVIDIGINKGPDNKICGDADYEDIFDLCSAITPVPGGVGPMTVAVLMGNVLKAAKRNMVI